MRFLDSKIGFSWWQLIYIRKKSIEPLKLIVNLASTFHIKEFKEPIYNMNTFK